MWIACRSEEHTESLQFTLSFNNITLHTQMWYSMGAYVVEVRLQDFCVYGETLDPKED
jgi:hypothetical protein